MRGKFLGGPYHGKSMQVDPQRIFNHSIVVADTRRVPWLDVGVDHHLTPADFNNVAPIRQHRYHIKMMSVSVDGRSYHAPAMHPDGSIFLVHENYKRGK